MPRSCPHARGDGPRRTPLGVRLLQLSPRAWGWSGGRLANSWHRIVVPTRVGMVRQLLRLRRGTARCPHARGDGPSVMVVLNLEIQLSPRAWGWSVHNEKKGHILRVVPTRVGMVREFFFVLANGNRCPHARGDGPWVYALTTAAPTLSPRAWGWSGFADAADGCVAVVPTRVGMVRQNPACPTKSKSCPHARGDGPLSENYHTCKQKLSPRAWGWSAMGGGVHKEVEVVPTRVGMVRPGARHGWQTCGCPHARGDGPLTYDSTSVVVWLSPRAWGWSATAYSMSLADLVVPTRVGMVRWFALRRALHHGCPHARGDGPVVTQANAWPGVLSPRAWGWSA